MVEAVSPQIRAHFDQQASKTQRNVDVAEAFLKVLSKQAIAGAVKPDDVVKANRMADRLDQHASVAALAGIAAGTDQDTLAKNIGTIEDTATRLRHVVAGMG